MIRKSLLWILAAVLLVGCAAPQRTPFPVDIKTRPPTSAAPQEVPTVVRTLVPLVTASPAIPPGYPAPGEAAADAAASATALATDSAAPAYPAPQVIASSPTARASGAPAAPFQDCARTPGLVGCGADAVPIKARLAFVENLPPRLVGLDLETGQGWQAPLVGSTPEWLDWSAGGQAEARLLLALGAGQYQVYAADGQLLETFSSQAVPAWQPDGALSRDGSVRNPQGDSARVEQAADLAWLLRVKTAQGEQSLPLEATGDMLIRLLDWVPGEQKLLAQAYFAGNQAMTQGGQLVVIDAGSGAMKPFQAAMPAVDFPQPYYAWDPAKTTRLALLETGESGVLSPRLALLDAETGQVAYPLPEGEIASSFAWHPDGRLAFAVPGGETAAQSGSSAPGIKLLDPHTGKINPLVQPPPGATDTGLSWAADGQVLVYLRALPGRASELTIAVRARRLADGAEWVIAQGLPAIGPANDPGFPGRLLAVAGK